MLTKEQIERVILDYYNEDNNKNITNINEVSELYYESEDEDILSYNLEMLLSDLWSKVNLDLMRYVGESDVYYILTTYVHLTDTKKYSVILSWDLELPTTLNEVIDMILYYQEEIEEIERA